MTEDDDRCRKIRIKPTKTRGEFFVVVFEQLNDDESQKKN